MYATTTTGHRPHVTVSKDTRMLQSMYATVDQSITFARLIQRTTTTTEVWLGLKYSDAQSVCVASETSTLNGTTRNFLGGARIQVGAGTGSKYTTVEGCWGTKVSSQLSRMGDTNCYQVTRTTQEFVVFNNGGSMTLL